MLPSPAARSEPDKEEVDMVFETDRLILRPWDEVDKEMLLVQEVDNREKLCGLLSAMYEELPKPKKKKRRGG